MPETRSAERQPGRPFLGWRHEVLVPAPGPPPRRPVPEEHVGADAEWEEDTRRSQAEINRPLLFVLCVLVGVGTVLLLLTMVGVLPLILTLVGAAACLTVAFPVILVLAQSRQDVGRLLTRERDRRARRTAEQQRLLRQRQEEHAARHAEWQHRKRVYEAQPRWYAVAPPEHTTRVTVVGGTDVGWSALLATVGASRLKDGGDLTVVDLSGRAAAEQLVSLAQRCGLIPRVWVLPANLPQMRLGSNLDGPRRADILASTVLAVDPRADIEADHAILSRIFTVLGDDTEIVRVTAALGLIALPGQDEARDDPALTLLTPKERVGLRAAFARDPAAVERAPALQRALIPFEGLGSRAESEPYAQLKVIATERSAREFAPRAYGTYTVDALSELLDLRVRRGGRNRPWAHTIILCGADTLPDWAVRRLVESAGRAATGVVLMYRTMSEHALAQLRAERSLPVVMRQPDAEAAETAVDFLGPGRAVRLHPLTEIVGDALDGTTTDGYVTDTAERVTAASPVRYSAKSIAPLTLVRHIRSATAWGKATAQAADHDTPDSDGGEQLIDQRLNVYGLRHLPHTAMIVPGPADSPVVADANPGLLTLPAATLKTVDEAGPERLAEEVPAEDEVPANVGPPPERLDWRRTGV